MTARAAAYAVSLAALLAACTERVAGGGSETEYFTLKGEADLATGEPAAGARVSVRPADHLTGEGANGDPAVRDTVLDAEGAFSLAGLPPGDYAVEIRLGDSLAVLLSVAKGPSPVVSVAGTLLPMGRLRASISAPEPGTAYHLRIRGLDRLASADPSGNLSVTLPAGVHLARLSAGREGAVPLLYSAVAVRPGADTVLAPLPAGDFLPGAAVPVLYDCNLGIAADDAGGLAVLHGLAGLGEARIVAAGTSQPSRMSAAALDAINTWYGRPAIPVGAWKKEKPADRAAYDSLIAAEFPQDLPAWEDVPEAAAVYREALAGLPDGRAVLVVGGGVHNVWDLLRRDRDLVARKVRELVVMGGAYPSGREHNFAAAVGLPGLPNLPAEVVRDWPGAITFHGHEVAAAVRSGACLGATSAGHPVRRIYALSEGGEGRASGSADLSPVLYSVRGAGTLYGRVTTGSNTVAADGSNAWVATPDLDQAYLVRRAPEADLAAALEDLLCREP